MHRYVLQLRCFLAGLSFLSARAAQLRLRPESESESGAGAAPALSATQLIFPPSTWLESYYFYDN